MRNGRRLTVTGTNHLIAISGLHIGLVAGMAYLLMLKVWGLLQVFAPGRLGSIPAIRAAALCAMSAALFYALAGGVFTAYTTRPGHALGVFRHEAVRPYGSIGRRAGNGAARGAGTGPVRAPWRPVSGCRSAPWR